MRQLQRPAHVLNDFYFASGESGYAMKAGARLLETLPSSKGGRVRLPLWLCGFSSVAAASGSDLQFTCLQ